MRIVFARRKCLVDDDFHSAIQEDRALVFLGDSLGSDISGSAVVKSCKACETWQVLLWEGAVVRFLSDGYTGKTSDRGHNCTPTNSILQWYISWSRNTSPLILNQRSQTDEASTHSTQPA